MSALFQKDGYKVFHPEAYHPSVSKVYVNFTSRNGKHSNVEGDRGVISLGQQYFIKDFLIREFNDTFFNVPKEDAVKEYKRVLSAYLGGTVHTKIFEDLHDLGYLPLRIKALPEGSLVPYGVACMTLENTVDGFQWLPNMIETVMSCEIWPIQTSATTSAAYYKGFVDTFKRSGLSAESIPFMGHDFSFRGMFGRQAAAMSGFGHLASGFVGTDTIPSIPFAEKFYNADCEKELIGCSVPATEHSVTCSWEEEGEEAFFNFLMEEKAKTGILSLVSDTWDFWSLVTELLPSMKDKIMAREGTVVIRPDSGDPVDILCGTLPKSKSDSSPEEKGLIECLWDTFGGTETDLGYKVLDSHIGAIYGDSITLARQSQIAERLMRKGFAPNVVLGLGSYTYQFVTRDTHGSAVKATNIVKDGVDVGIAKDPKTDQSKKSARGLLRVEQEAGTFVMYDQQTREESEGGCLQEIFLDGVLTKETSLSEIRERISLTY